MENIVAIYKPKGPTSHDVIDLVRKATGEQTVGHAGTLDPLASGVLVVAIGRQATKQLATIVKKEKEYYATIRLGLTSTTDDEEGAKTKPNFISTSPPEIIAIDKVLASMVGDHEQVPPIYSALKVGGVPAYSLARQGKDVLMKPRIVTIKHLEKLKYEWPLLKLRVVTGPGVYIRALARDIGHKLGCGAYLAELERTRVGDFDKTQALTLDQLHVLKK